MRICVVSEGPTLDSKVDTRFGRGRYFVFVDPDTLEFEAVENPSINAMGGAGIQAAQLVAQKAKVVITGGNFGPNAAQALSSFGVEMIGDFSGTVKEAIEAYKKGALGGGSAGGTSSPNVSSMGENPATDIEVEEVKRDAMKISNDIENAKKRIDNLMKGE